MANKFKNWIKEHKLELFVGGGALVIFGAGVILGKNLVDHDLIVINNGLRTLMNNYSNVCNELGVHGNSSFYISTAETPVHFADQVTNPMISEDIVSAASEAGVEDAILKVVMVAEPKF